MDLFSMSTYGFTISMSKSKIGKYKAIFKFQSKQFPLILREITAIWIRFRHASLGFLREHWQTAQQHVNNLPLDLG